MKTFAKILLSGVLLCGAFIPLVSCDDDHDEVETIITVDNLPDAAKTFLSTFFYGVDVQKIEKETVGTVIIYEVDLVNGYEVVFNSDGDWIEVDAPEGKTIPSGIAPEVIENYLNTNYSGYGINEINKTGMGYNIELTNGQGGPGITLNFNEAGEVIGTPNN